MRWKSLIYIPDYLGRMNIIRCVWVMYEKEMWYMERIHAVGFTGIIPTAIRQSHDLVEII